MKVSEGPLRSPSIQICAGSALIMVLVCMLIMNGLAVTLLHSASLQLRYSSNLERQLEALVLADSVTTAVLERPENFPDGLSIGAALCEALDEASVCEVKGLTYALPSLQPAGLEVSVRVERRAPTSVQVETGEGGGFVYNVYEVDVEITNRSSGSVAARTITGVAAPAATGLPKTLYWREPAIDAV